MVTVSVCMPVYNAEKYVAEAIESVLSQTYKDFEFIIVDDSSTDGSWKIIQEYADKDTRIRAFRNKKNGGVVVSLNNALKKAKGVYIARMDADDICVPTRFEKQVALLKKNDVVGSNIQFIDEQGKKKGVRVYSNAIDRVVRVESPLAHPSVMLKKELFDTHGLYREEFNSAEDYDRWLCFYSRRATFYVIQETLLHYRTHAQQVKVTALKKTLRTTLKVKWHAAKEYGVRFGLRGNLRMLAERIALLLPNKVLLFLFYALKRSS